MWRPRTVGNMLLYKSVNLTCNSNEMFIQVFGGKDHLMGDENEWKRIHYFHNLRKYMMYKTKLGKLDDNFIQLYDVLEIVIQKIAANDRKLGTYIFTHIRRQWKELDKWLSWYIDFYNKMRSLYDKNLVRQVIRYMNHPILFNGVSVIWTNNYPYNYPMVLLSDFNNEYSLPEKKIVVNSTKSSFKLNVIDFSFEFIYGEFFIEIKVIKR